MRGNVEKASFYHISKQENHKYKINKILWFKKK